MISYEQISAVNEDMRREKIRGSEYAPVAARVAAFREICPNGAIVTEIVHDGPDMVIIKATVMDDSGKWLATGHAYEREGSSQINGTSFIENCETSAVGRALGMLGLGSRDTMASAEEMANAINQQEMCNANEIRALKGVCEKLGKDPAEVFPSWPEVTKKDYGSVMRRINEQSRKR